jgi:UDP-glucose 4-epimerase
LAYLPRREGSGQGGGQPQNEEQHVRVVVTGGAGFIGANLSRELVGRGHEVVVLDDLSTGDRRNLEGVDVRLVEGSILDGDALDDALPGAASVVHLGARPSVPKSIIDPVATHEVNATGTMRVLEGLRRHEVPHVVVASSSSVYGANPVLPKREDLAPMPVSPYAASKLATESYALAWAASFGFGALAFRFFNVFGPLQPAGHDYAAVVPAFVDAALAGRPLPIDGDGEQSRDFTFVGSVAGVLADAVERSVTSPTPVNLAFGSRVTLLELVAHLEGVLGHPLDREHRSTRAGDVRHSQADQHALQALFPDARPVPLVEGLQQTVDWFRSCTGS